MGGHGSGRPPGVKGLVDRQLGRNSNNTILPAGDGFIIPNLSGDHSAGTTGTPVDDRDIANKKYVDDNVGGAHTESSTDSLTNKTIDDFSNDVEADEIHIEVRYASGS